MSKFDICTNDYEIMNQKLFNGSPYFEMVTHKVVSSKNHHSFPDFSLGLEFGVKYKKRYFFQIGINQDGSRSSISVNTYTFQNNSFYNNGIGIKTSRTFARLYTQFSYLINEKKVLKLIVGIGLALRSKDSKNYYQETGFSWDYSNNVKIIVQNDTYLNSRKSLLFHFGFENDVSFKGKYLFSWSVFYSQSKKSMTSLLTNIKVQTSTELYNYKYTTYSRGSGLYLTISRQFQVYPWRKRKK